MKRPYSPLLPLTLLGSALASAASGQQFHQSHGYERDVAFANAVDTYGDTAVVDLDGDMLNDVFVVYGDQLLFFWALATFDSQGPTQLNASAVAAYQDDPLEPGRLLTLHNGTVSVVHFDPNQTMTMPNNEVIDGKFIATPISGLPSRLGAKSLITVDLNGDGLLDAVVHNTGSTGFQTIQNLGNDSWAAGPSKANAGVGTGFELKALDMDGDGLMEIACSGDQGLRTYEFNYNNGHFTRVVGASVTATGVDDPIAGLSVGGGMGAVTMIGTNVNDEHLVTLNTAGILESSNIPNIQAIAITESDVNDDGLSDIVVSNQFAHHVYIALQQARNSHSDPFWALGDPTQFFTVQLRGGLSPAPNNFSRPAMRDYDWDGDEDLVFLNQTYDKIDLKFNGTYASTSLQPQLDDIKFVPTLFETGGDIATEGTLSLRYDLIDQTGLGTSYTHLKWFVVSAKKVAGNWRIIPGTTIPEDRYGWFNLADEAAEGNTTVVAKVENWDVSNAPGLDEIAFVVARYVEAEQVTYRTLALGPHATHTYVHTDGDVNLNSPAGTVYESALDFVTSLPGSPTSVEPVEDVFDNTATGGEEVGGSTPCQCLPIGCAPPPLPQGTPQGTGN